MDIAILFRGISYSDGTKRTKVINPLTNKPYQSIAVDFLDGPFQSFVEKISKPLKAEGHKISIYGSTYESEKIADILQALQSESETEVVCSTIEPESTGKSGQAMTANYGMELIQPCDYVFVTRFDLTYKETIVAMGADPQQTFILWREKDHWESMHQVCDLFFGYPYKYNNVAMQACQDIIYGNGLPHRDDFHFIWRAMMSILKKESTSDIRIGTVFASEDYFKTSGPNPFVEVTRRKVDTTRVISHRGNINGPNELEENRPDIVTKRLGEGYQVEVDVWYHNNQFYFGHDNPQYLLSDYIDNPEIFLLDKDLWCHAKNVNALDKLLLIGAHCFWHQEDRVTLTSKGYIWTYPGETEITPSSICVLNDRPDWRSGELSLTCAGICTDYAAEYKKKTI